MVAPKKASVVSALCCQCLLSQIILKTNQFNKIFCLQSFKMKINIQCNY